jgi:hypothetical protein
VEFVALVDTVVTDFVQTWESVDDLNAKTVQSNMQVLITVGTLGILFVVGILAAHRLDVKDTRLHAVENSVLNFIDNSAASKRAKRQRNNRLQIKDPTVLSIESALPLAYRSTPFLSRFMAENKKFHRWIGVVFHYSPYFSRALRVMSLATAVITMLFMQALMYNISQPGNK